MSRQRRLLLCLLLVLNVLLVAVPPLWRWDRQRRAAVWQQRLVELAYTQRRAAPVIAAIRAHEREHGRPPADLADLVPRYLRAIPEVGPVGRGTWTYSADPSCWGIGRLGAGRSRWLLQVRVRADFDPRNPFSLGDTFVYLPAGDYPREGFGGILDRVGDWGYYQE